MNSHDRGVALTRAIHRAAYAGIDHIDKDADSSEVGCLDSHGSIIDLDGEHWRIVVEKC